MSNEPDIQEILKVGMKVDVFDDGLKKWLPGVIKEFERVNAQTAKLKVAKEGMPDSSQEKIVWPKFEKVDFCSRKIPKRDCGKDVPDKPKVISIAFVTTDAP